MRKSEKDPNLCRKRHGGHKDFQGWRVFASLLRIPQWLSPREQIKAAAAEFVGVGVVYRNVVVEISRLMGQLYRRERYEYRGKYANSRFERDCLEEYGEVFKTVCVDAAYYDFPRREYLLRLTDAVPEDFQFGFKVTDAITLKHFPNLPRFGVRAGQPNRDFLNADLFATAFLRSCEEIRTNVGVLMFEFSRFHPITHGKRCDR